MYEIKNLTYQPIRLLLNGINVIITGRDDDTNNFIMIESITDDLKEMEKKKMIKIKAIKKPSLARP